MAECGVPTLTCVLLLLFMAGLYAGASSDYNDGIAQYKMDLPEMDSYNIYKRGARVARSPRLPGSPRISADKRKRGGQGNANKKQDRRKRPITEGGRRPRPGSNKDGLPPGINRRMMKLAEKIHTASTPFAVRLFRVVTPQTAQNIVLSPFSVHTALTMTMLGAKGRTEKEMFNVLGHRQAKLRNKKPHQAYKALLASLQSVHPEVKIASANAVFVKPNIPLEDAFRQGLTQMYDATFDSFQFNHPQGPEGPINSWVSNVTNDKIQNLLPARTITPLTALVLVNAIYFNASWSNPFTKSHTRPDQFHTLAGQDKTVDMMRADHSYRYANHYNTEVIEMLYKGDRLAMYILLPNPTSNITQLQKEVLTLEKQDTPNLDRMFENLNPEMLKLYLPKFKIETESLSLKQPLQMLGIVKAFDPKQADFSGISASRDLYIDEVFHKAFIDVSESGTEAAAATGVVMGMRSSFIPEAREVKVDRPFMFVIRDKMLKEILFIGAYVG